MGKHTKMQTELPKRSMYHGTKEYIEYIFLVKLSVKVCKNKVYCSGK